MTIRRKDAFLAPSKHGKHLTVALTDTFSHRGQSALVVTNFSTWTTYKDQSCVVEAGVHPFIVAKSVIEYEHTRLTLESYVQDGFRTGTFVPKECVSDSLWSQIESGFRYTKDVSIELVQLLMEHGFPSS